MAGPFLAVFGDSVAWGQGLHAGNKTSVRVANALAPRFPGMIADTWAHSGAVIGWSAQLNSAPADGEVPDACPTIRQQVERYDKAPADVPVVWVNGGINDIDVRVILNPLTQPKDLSDDIRHYCFDHMVNLLQQVQSKFTQSTAIVVTSYYPILSTRSDPVHIPKLLDMLAIGIPALVAATSSSIRSSPCRCSSGASPPSGSSKRWRKWPPDPYRSGLPMCRSPRITPCSGHSPGCSG